MAKKNVVKDIVGYRHNNIRIESSPGRGRGVFAAKAFKKGDLIELAPVILVPNEDADVLYCTLLQNYLFATESEDATVLGLGFTSLYNHSSHPNADFYATKKTIAIKALANIREGDEIFVDYGWEEKSLKSFKEEGAS